MAGCSGIGSKIDRLPADAAARGYVLLPRSVRLPRSRLSSDCGPESMSAVLDYWGRAATVDQASRMIRDPRMAGVFSSDLPILARQMGLKAAFVDGGVGRIKRAIDRQVPPILMIDAGASYHFFVATGYSDLERAVVVEEYEDSKRVISYDELEERWQRTRHWMLEVEPSTAEADYHAGSNLEAEGLFAEAAVFHRRALAAEPDFAEARLGLANCLLGLGKIEEALGEYRRALEGSPDDPKALNNTANILLELRRDPAEAERLAEKAVEKTEAAFKRAREEAERPPGSAPRAAVDRNVRDRERDLAHALGTLGQARAAGGKHALAIAAFQASYEHFPLTEFDFRAKRLYEMGMAYRAQDMPVEGKKWLDQALQLVRAPKLRAQIEAAVK